MALLSYGTTAIKTPFIIADRLSVNHSIPILLETSSLEHAVLIRSNRSCRKSERRLSTKWQAPDLCRRCQYATLQLSHRLPRATASDWCSADKFRSLLFWHVDRDGTL